DGPGQIKQRVALVHDFNDCGGLACEGRKQLAFLLGNSIISIRIVPSDGCREMHNLKSEVT
ncbi:MAG: hypothetical protein P4L55_09140, partial [Syntrophobacteraceae bacterium]|nr:hypothetical protein [Syntrophobacteraceae bacterium]